MEQHQYDFSGWATRNDLVCADGRTIRKDAFKACDGLTVPLVWNHCHSDPENVLGHALLENRADGVYAYGYFNNSENGKAAKELVRNGDVRSLSIYATGLKQTRTKDVMHGDIVEVSLVVGGANPGAFIDFVDMAHSGDAGMEEECILSAGEPISLFHSAVKPPLTRRKSEDAEKGNEKPDTDAKDAEKGNEKPDTNTKDAEKDNEKPDTNTKDAEKDNEKPDTDAKDAEKGDEKPDKGGTGEEKTLRDVLNSMTEEQQDVTLALVTSALEAGESHEDEADEKKASDKKSETSEGGNTTMKHNVFEQEENKDNVMIHSEDRAKIIELAKSKSCGSLRDAITIYMEQNELQHGIDNIERLFPDFQNVTPGAPEKVTRDLGWVDAVLKKVSKTPISRIRTRQTDTRVDGMRARGFKKGAQKTPGANAKAIARTTDPQTIYVNDSLSRDDILDITDFDVVEYQYGMMRDELNEEIAIAIMIGDGRSESDPHKISESHVRSIWNDDETYTIHYDVDLDAARQEIQGTDTAANFGENYIYAEAVISAALYSREKYKGSGKPDFYCTPHLVNVMLLARDLNGRRIYNSESDLAAALNVDKIHTAEQFEGLVRTDAEGKQHKLLGLFVHLPDYKVGAVKGGEVTRFSQFDIDFNNEKYLIETRMSGALTRVESAIALEEPVSANP